MLAHQPLRQLIRQADAVVLAAILGVDLEHIGEVEAGQRRLVRRDVRAVVAGDDGLGERRRESPDIRNPVAGEGGVEPLQRGQELRQRLLGPRAQQWSTLTTSQRRSMAGSICSTSAITCQWTIR